MIVRRLLAGLCAALFTAYFAALATLVATDPKAADKAGTLTPFLVAAGVAGVLAYVASARPVVARVSFLRPGSFELNRILQAGNALIKELGAVKLGTDGASDETLRAQWETRIDAWYQEARRSVERYAPDYLSHFESDADFSGGVYQGVPEWANKGMNFIRRRLSRLSDILMKV